MKVRELIKELSALPPDQEVLLAQPDGDICFQLVEVKHTIVKACGTRLRKGAVLLFMPEYGCGSEFEF